MKYYVPKLEPAKTYNTQNGLKEKFGGLPFGLPAELYPLCQECRNPMSLLVQFVHDSERLNLGCEGRALMVFQCGSGTCAVWDDDSGANACFVVEPETLTERVEKLPDGKIEPEKEYWVTGWEEFDDDVSTENAAAFFDGDKYYDFEEDEFEDLIENVTEKTRLGSVPFWIQYPEVPEGSWKFVGQLDDLTGFNFGDAGIGYIFIENTDNDARLPKGKFLWQCG